MPKISTRASTLISFILAVALVVVLLGIMIIIPFFLEKAPMLSQIYDWFAEKNGVLGISGGAIYWIWLYVILAIAEACCLVMVFLLLRVRKGLVFTEKSVAYVRFISWGCLFIAFACMLVVYYFHMSYLIALAAGFLGICVRVVKNVIEEATEIKSENDLTV